jgi:4-hydroxy-2-oxoglutarate aldolase
MPALITPFDAAGDLDLAAHRHNVEVLSKLGIDGLLIAGSTGEGPYLEPGERQRLLRTAREAIGNDNYLTCGVAAETVRQALAMINEAVDGGGDSALVITPTTLTRNRLLYVEGYYQTLAEVSPIPILLYSVPPVTAFELPEDVVVRLSRHPNVIGLKDSGGDPVRMQRLVASVEEGFHLFTGSTQALTLAIAAGAYGAITASTNYLPDLLLELVAVAADDPLKARTLQQRVSAISAGVERLGIPGVKAAAAIGGLLPGLPRLPLAPIAGDQAAALAELISAS